MDVVGSKFVKAADMIIMSMRQEKSTWRTELIAKSLLAKIWGSVDDNVLSFSVNSSARAESLIFKAL